MPTGIGAMARVLLLNQRLGLASNDISQRTNNSPIASSRTMSKAVARRVPSRCCFPPALFKAAHHFSGCCPRAHSDSWLVKMAKTATRLRNRADCSSQLPNPRHLLTRKDRPRISRHAAEFRIGTGEREIFPGGEKPANTAGDPYGSVTLTSSPPEAMTAGAFHPESAWTRLVPEVRTRP